jgi:hypothetical protein
MKVDYLPDSTDGLLVRFAGDSTAAAQLGDAFDNLAAGPDTRRWGFQRLDYDRVGDVGVVITTYPDGSF